MEAVFSSPLYEKERTYKLGLWRHILESGNDVILLYYEILQSTPATFSGNSLQINLRWITSVDFK